MAPLWRKAFDAIERPLAAGSEAWIQSETFMDLAAHSIRVKRRMLHEVQHATERWLHLWGWVSRGDVIRLSGHIGFVAGRQAAKVARPQIRDWLAGHSEADRLRAAVSG